MRTRTDWLWEGGDPAGGRPLTTSYIHDPAGNLLAVTDSLGRVTQVAYDSAERAVTRIDPAGNRLDTTYDAAGNPVSVVATEQGPGGPATVAETYRYDALNRQVLRQDGLGNRTESILDARGHAIATIDPEGHLTARTFDSLDRMLTETLPEGISVTRSYDRASRPVSYRDALGNTTAWTYDALGRRTQTTYPDGTAETFVYDATGDLIHSQDANGTAVEQAFDEARRPMSRVVTRGPGIIGPTGESYQHDGLGRLTSLDSGGLITTLAYDSLSRLTTETENGRAIHYDRDDAGNPTSVTYPSGLQVARSFDPLDRPQTIGPPADPTASYTYRGPALVATKTLDNGLIGSMTFDSVRRPLESRYQEAGGDTVFQEGLSWSPRSLKSAISRGDLNGSGLAVGYDGAGRLLAAAKLADPLASLPNNSTADPAALAGESEVSAFTYDAAQNLLSKTVVTDGIPTSVELPLDASGRNRPAAVDGTPLAWDANGNLIQKGDQHFAYDYRNRLSRVTDAQGAEVARYEYDGFNRRVRRIVGGDTEETVWSGWQPLEAYHDGQLAERRTYGRGLDEIVRSRGRPRRQRHPRTALHSPLR